MAKDFVDTLIIGAGASGLALARLFDGKKEFLILEGHSLPGGCAGYFSRGKFHFDVGATTVSGLSHDGPVRRMKELTGFDPDLIKVDPGMEIFIGEHRLQRFEDPRAWAHECRKIDGGNLEDLFLRIHELNEVCWSLTKETALFPPRSFPELSSLLTNNFSQKIRLLPLFLRSFEGYFNLRKLSPELRTVIDEILLISTQSQAAQAPAFVGAMGLSYPEDVWYPCGGMKAFFGTLASPVNDRILLRHKVEKIRRLPDGFHVETNKGSFRCREIFSTLPVWDSARLLGEKHQSGLVQETWGALTAYYKIRLRSSEQSLYQQLHRRLAFSGSNSLFLSLSHPSDHLHAPEGYRTLTVSTHIRYADYQRAIESGREQQRETWSKELEAILVKHFGADLLDLDLVGFGDPETFVKFTSRSRGSVGGIPHSLRRNIFTYPKSKGPIPGFYQLGDTTFPGQGIVGVFQGALNLATRLNLEA